MRVQSLLISFFLVLSQSMAFASNDLKRISVGDAIILLNAHGRAHPNEKFNVSEVSEETTDEIWNQLHMQIFKCDSSVVMIKNEKVHKIAGTFGGGIESLAVSTLNAARKPQLLYAWTFGSGMHYGQVAVFDEKQMKPVDLVFAHFLTLTLNRKNEDQFDVHGHSVFEDPKFDGSIGFLVRGQSNPKFERANELPGKVNQAIK